MQVKIIVKQYREVKEGVGVYNLESQNEIKRPQAVAGIMEILHQPITHEKKANMILDALTQTENFFGEDK